MTRVRVETLGCRVNRYDSAALRGQLVAAGYELAEEGAPFDVFVLNGCTVTASADRDGRNRLARARRSQPGAALVVTGCQTRAAELPVDLIVENRDKTGLVTQLDSLLGRSPSESMVPHAFPLPDERSTRFFLKVQEGCDVRCAFCVIPDVRGPARSIPLEEVVRLAVGARDRGFEEIVLAGIHLGGYGRDLPEAPSLAGLVRQILEATGIARLRLGSVEPWGVKPELVRLFAEEPRLLSSLPLPLQSGSERILRAMRRPITAARYQALVGSLLQARPDLGLQLDVLVGFPGESDCDFAETVRFLEDLPFVRLHVFPYSSRPGTAAAELPNPVAHPILRERVEQLLELSDRRFRSRLESRLGSTDEVLVERGRGGQTRDGLPCQVVSAADRGRTLRVRLESLSEDGQALRAVAA